MRAGVLVVAVLAGCGQVKGGTAIDAAAADAPASCPGTTIEACGAACLACPTGDDREDPTCNGTACGITCTAGAPMCTDSSCSRTLWAFDTGMLDGITPRAPAGLALAVRNHLGSPALAVDVTSLTEISFRLPVCLSGTVDLRNKVFTMDVFFEGGDPTGEQYFVQVSVPDPQGASVGFKALQAGMTVAFSGTIPAATTTETATEITIQAGSFGAAFAGTIWFDNLRAM